MFSFSEADIQPCAKVQTSSTVVPLGSPVTATCAIREDCPLVTGQAVHIEWRLGDRFIPSSPVANGSDRISEVVISNFNQTREFLTCYIQASPPQVVAGVDIRAGCKKTLSTFMCLVTHLIPCAVSQALKWKLELIFQRACWSLMQLLKAD